MARDTSATRIVTLRSDPRGEPRRHRGHRANSASARPAADFVGRAANREERQKHKPGLTDGLRFWRSSQFAARPTPSAAGRALAEFSLCLRGSSSFVVSDFRAALLRLPSRTPFDSFREAISTRSGRAPSTRSGQVPSTRSAKRLYSLRRARRRCRASAMDGLRIPVESVGGS